MPKFSKKKTSTKSPYKSISHVSSIGEKNNLVLEIVGLGRCTTEMLGNTLSNKVENVNIFNALVQTHIKNFVEIII